MPRIAISAPNSAAAKAGIAIAEHGGNAVDAAVGAGFVAATSEPGLASLGGAAYVTIFAPSSGSAVVIDGGARVPGVGTPAQRLAGRDLDLHALNFEYGGRRLNGYSGWASAATPGGIAALHLAHRMFGGLSWCDVVAPSISVAKSGFVLGKSAASYLSQSAARVFARDDDVAAAVFDASGNVVDEGATVTIPNLAGFLERLSSEGPACFYGGEVARRLAEEMNARGGLITAADLRSYKPVARRALARRFGSWQIYTNPPPSRGGSAIVRLVQDLATCSEASDDEAFAASLVGGLRRQLWPHGGLRRGARTYSGAPSTVHISAVDAVGLACSATISSGYGAGVAVPSTGIWLNNALGESELNRPGMYVSRPGVTIPSNMAPTVIVDDAGAVVSVGTPGAERIVSAMSLVLASVIFGGLNLAEAIARPRVHLSRRDDLGTLDIEAPLDGRMMVVDESWERRLHPRRSMYFGGVAAAALEADGGLAAFADPRRQGCAVVSL